MERQLYTGNKVAVTFTTLPKYKDLLRELAIDKNISLSMLLTMAVENILVTNGKKLDDIYNDSIRNY